MNKIDVGDTAPVWEVRDQNDTPVNANRYLGNRNVLLSFHPLAWTPVCARQMQDLEARHDELERLETVAFGFSVDSVPCKKAWADSLGIRKTALPSDFWPHGAVAQAYGVFIEDAGYSARAVFLIDRRGKVSFKKVYPLEELPDMDEVINAVKGLEPVRLG